MEVHGNVDANCSQSTHSHPLFSILQGTNYTCPHCTVAFEDEKELQEHVSEHLIKKQEDFPDDSDSSVNERLNHTCTLCQAPYKTKAGLKRHVKTVHSQCKRNPNVLDRNPFNHFLVPTEDEDNGQRENLSFICQLCAAPYKTEQGLLRHSETNHRNQIYSCDFCDCQFSGILGLNDHINSEHSNKIKNSLDSLRQGNKYPQLSDIEEMNIFLNYACPFCAAPYKTEQGLLRHAEIAHINQMYSCDFCNGEFSGILSLNDHITTEHAGNANAEIVSNLVNNDTVRSEIKGKSTFLKYTCSTCTTSFKSTVELLRHAITAHRNKPYSCDHCDREFTGVLSLNDHIRAEHSFLIKTEISLDCSEKQNQEHPVSEPGGRNEKLKFACPFCTAPYKTEQGLIHHIKIIHKTQSYNIKLGGKVSDLPFLCVHCGARFRGEQDLILHVEKFHRVKNEPEAKKSRLTVKVSNKQCNPNLKKQDLKPEVVDGKGLHCNICGAPFTYRGRLKRHLLLVHNQPEC